MAAKLGKKFCVEHGALRKENDLERIPCPYDSKHTCYATKLQKHLKICNSRPKELPEYIVPKINVTDTDYSDEFNENYAIGSVSDELLLELIQRIEKVFLEKKLDCKESILNHEVINSTMEDSEMGSNSKKHLLQNSSLLKNMEENGFLNDKTTFVEFGAGRGQLGFWIMQAIGNSENCALVLIDKASHRHKSDNKLKGKLSQQTLRIRADIADIELSKIPLLHSSDNEIVGVTKHLCGLATDLALRCLVNGKTNGLNVKGIVMAFCCHHRCSWSSFAGKQFLLSAGFSSYQFPALCSISSWATCGSGKSRFKIREEKITEETSTDRYKRFGLSQEIRENIGRKCKMILNHSRLKYLESYGFEGKLIYYVDQNISPENVCVIAKRK